ncbi:Circadian-associated transcriptional repressor ChIP-derived repressor of network oscillator [Channa argus]|uniref:Circadian-associated transcriptional repressor ChIP-derived repressor of network oscillator n=1 Tax=Channa argus TaxID=215402 RepID=A0A6G1QX92_CHAAH|nr:Circadian-associated transcriptional repressor ChIP-derived repressor of network oscillator [Channa argus]KAK2920958.1 hypothetical protein Q8A73_000443 [Channa argus]
MNSLGSSSAWPSCGLLPSTTSFLVSESEQTEDEGDFLSEGEGGNERTKSLLADERITLSGNYLNFPGQCDDHHLRSKNDQSKDCPCEAKYPNSASSPGAATLGSSATPGDLAFAQKCADLHRFIHPLLELLHGLKTGRFDKGLTSFQQSVAMDRLQRILGILQKPEMGEKYLQNLLQIEMMLKIWFPQVAFQSTLKTLNKTTTPRLSQSWHKNQLHMPVKKRKLSWSEHPELAGKVPTKCKHHQHRKHGSCHASMSLVAVSTCLPGSTKRRKVPKEEILEATGNSCTAGHEFTDSTGTLSRLYSEGDNENQKQPQISPPSPCDSPATQDSSVSSSDTMTTADSP